MPAVAAATEGAGPAAPGVCFQKAELYDVIDPTTGAKIAGAAQKRNKHGLLFQGSIWRPAAGAGVGIALGGASGQPISGKFHDLPLRLP